MSAGRRFAVGRTVWRYLRPHRGMFVLALVPVLLIAACELLRPWPVQIVVDHVLGGTAPGWRPLAALAPSTLLLGACVGLVVLHLVLAGLQVLANGMTIGIGQRMVGDLRRDLYAHLQRLSPRFYAARSIGDLLARVTTDTLAVQTLAMNGVFPLVTAATLFAGMAAIMFAMDPGLTVLALAVCPVVFAVVSMTGRRIRAVASGVRSAESRLLGVAQQGLAGMRIVQAFTAEPGEADRFVASSRTSLDASWRLYLWQTLATGLVAVVVAGGTGLVLWVGATHVMAGTLTVGQVLVFVAYLAALYAPVTNVSETLGMIQQARVGAERVLELLEVAPDLPDGAQTLAQDPARGRVELTAVSFAYEPGQPVLCDVSFAVAPGEMVAVVGRSGGGKTTLAMLLARFLDPEAGAVTLDGVDVRSLRVRDLRRQVSMVLQPPLVFPLTVRENVTYGLPFADDAAVARALEIAQLDELVQRLPAGLGTMLGDGGATLSEGERQRLTIARALLRDAPVLVLDEPTSALDAATEAAVMAGIRAHASGRATIVIAHRLAAVRAADRILVLEEGRIVEHGTFDELMALGARFAGLHAAQEREAACGSS